MLILLVVHNDVRKLSLPLQLYESILFALLRFAFGDDVEQ